MLLSLWQCVYDELNTRIVIFQACVLFYIQIHVLYIYYIIELIIDWILTCWRSNWLKIKLFKLFYFSYLDQYYGYFPIINFSKQNFFYVVVDESCIGFLIQKLITSNLFVSLSLSHFRPTKSSFQRERFSFFFFPPTIQIRLSGRKTIEEALETISFDPKFHDSLARRHLASCLSDLKIITSGDNSRPVSWGYMTCARACTRELREM